MTGRAEPDRDAEDALSFCTRLRPRLVGTLTLSCGSAAVAEELTQETLARVWLNWPRVSRLDAPEGWAYRVATNLARSSFRRRMAERQARARYESRMERVHTDPDTADALVVRQALAALPPRQRTALAWRYYAGLSVEQTAGAMGCAPGTVRALTSQGLAALRCRPEFRAAEEVRDAR